MPVQAQSILSNRIDALQTDAQVLKFIRPLGWEYAEAILGDSAAIAYKPYDRTKLAIRNGQNWFKADFDHNGRTDLLVLARRKDIPLVFCVLDLGNGELRIVRNFYDAIRRRSPVARVVHRHGNDLLEYADFARSRGKHGQLRGRRKQLLQYGVEGFVAYTPHAIQAQAQRIELEAHSVYHQIVTNQIKVVGDSIWAWQRKQDVLDTTSVSSTMYHGKLLPKQQQELKWLLGYIRLAKAKQQYGQERLNHHTHVNLRIDYSQRKHVLIKDLNGNGTLALQSLYQLLWKSAHFL